MSQQDIGLRSSRKVRQDAIDIAISPPRNAERNKSSPRTSENQCNDKPVAPISQLRCSDPPRKNPSNRINITSTPQTASKQKYRAGPFLLSASGTSVVDADFGCKWTTTTIPGPCFTPHVDHSYFSMDCEKRDTEKVSISDGEVSPNHRRDNFVCGNLSAVLPVKNNAVWRLAFKQQWPHGETRKKKQ